MSNRRKTNRRRGDRRGPALPGGVGLGAGLALGLLVAAVVWWKDHRAAAPGTPPAESPPAAEAPVPAPAPTPQKSKQPPPPPPPPTEAPGRFQFYEMLPNFEVVVPEQEKKVGRGASLPPVEDPGIYVLQAGSFPEFAEADAVRARLALLGVSSQIQKVTVDEKTYHRVRVGPISDLNELNRLRNRLRQNRIDFLVIQVGE